jgi:hypothetical protein
MFDDNIVIQNSLSVFWQKLLCVDEEKPSKMDDFVRWSELSITFTFTSYMIERHYIITVWAKYIINVSNTLILFSIKLSMFTAFIPSMLYIFYAL